MRNYTGYKYTKLPRYDPHQITDDSGQYGPFGPIGPIDPIWAIRLSLEGLPPPSESSHKSISKNEEDKDIIKTDRLTIPITVTPKKPEIAVIFSILKDYVGILVYALKIECPLSKGRVSIGFCLKICPLAEDCKYRNIVIAPQIVAWLK